MEASNLQIYWHESQPVYSLCFPPSSKYDPQLPKLFTSGGDNKVRIWNLNTIKSTANESCFKIDTIDFLTSLQQHEQAINVIRFNSKGDILASAGDDGQILLWKRNLDGQSTGGTPFEFTTDEENENENNNKDKNKDKDNHSNNNNHVDGKSIKEENKESWYVWKRLRFHSHAPEIYDLVWSPCDNYILCGCMDNFIRVFQIHTNSNKDDDNDDPRCIFSLKEHNHYVQGVTWDPQNKYILSQSTDRSINVYKLIFDHENKQLLDIQLQNRIIKLDKSYMFHNETLPSFFRRLTISPCGNLILVPTGISKNNNDITSSLTTNTSIITTATTNNNNNNNNNNNSTEGANCVYIFARSTLKDNLNKPIMKISNLKKPALIISFNPNFYKIESTTRSEFISLPYKLIFAIATSNEILIYDTIKVEPLAIIGNLHYTPITDLTWSPDGKFLMISSTDGFCSYISIDANNLFGQRLKNDEIMKFKNVPSVSVPNDVTIENKPKHNIINILPVKKKIKPNNKQTNPTT
ncbi:Cac2p PWA37_001405 [Arxiozyma heterogenica]|uniref:Cac2p n=1 Tax=Arxiozyma heterogenica TaxID=278026 RepID=UPI002EFE0745